MQFVTALRFLLPEGFSSGRNIAQVRPDKSIFLLEGFSSGRNIARLRPDEGILLP